VTAPADSPPSGTDRLWTIPNGLSVLRLFGVPLFLWLLLGPHEDGWALVVLMVSGVIVGRDVVLGAVLPLLRRAGYGPPSVHYLGKAATFCLLYAFPLLLLGTYHGTTADLARPIAWAFTVWGTALYLWSGVVYLHQSAGLLRRRVSP
jgi:cardiolipin synthase (CMP-forming)